MTEIGNGGDDTSHYTDKFIMLEENENLTELDQPFIIQNEIDYNHIFMNNNKRKIFTFKNIIWNFLFEKSLLESCSKKEPWLLPHYQLLKGCMTIMNNSYGANNQPDTIVQAILILNGDFRGQVWTINGRTMYKTTYTALTFVNNLL